MIPKERKLACQEHLSKGGHSDDFPSDLLWEDVLWSRQSVFESWVSTLPKGSELCKLVLQKRRALNRPCWEDLLKLFGKLETPKNSFELTLKDRILSIGDSHDLTTNQRATVDDLIHQLIPWRKGPINLFGSFIDTEWRSDLKWDRISPYLSEMKGRRVLDLGCGNSYYMMRAMEFEPEFVLGLDPSEKFFLTSELFQHFLREERLGFEMLGAEHLGFFPKFFNVALCMGVLYHQRNPLGLLLDLQESLCNKGLAVIESQVIVDELDFPTGDYALFPQGRYAKARNVYFVPTVDCLCSWVRKAGFVDVEVVSVEKTDFTEQRSTPFAPYESLSDFLDPTDSSKTIEGYPAPHRAVVLARKRGRK